MNARDSLLDCLAELKSAHDKANRLMMEITALAASAAKGRGILPSLNQLHQYEKALDAAQQQAACCAELLQCTTSADAPATPVFAPAVH